MQENEFEKAVREKMQALELLPGDGVWQQVHDRIHQKRRRRLLVFWLAASLLLMLFAGGWWMLNKPATNNMLGQANKPVHKNPAGTAQATKDSILDYELKTLPGKPLGDKKLEKLPLKKMDVEKTFTIGKVPPTPFTKTIAEASATKDKTTIPMTVKSPGKVVPNPTTLQSTIATSNRRTAAAITLMHKYYHPEIDSLQTENTAKTVMNKDTALPAAVAKKAIPIPHHHTWQVGFAAAAGVSDNVGGLLSNLDKNYSADLSTVNNPANGATQNLAAIKYQTGRSLSFGMYGTHSLGLRTGISLGLDYHYFSSHSRVGGSMASPTVRYDSSLNSINGYYSYFTPGQSSTYTNRYNLLQAPVLVTYRVGKSVKKPVSIAAGLVPGYLFSHGVLYANYRQGVYYEETKQLNRLQLAGSARVTFPLLSAVHFRIAAGPVAEYSFTRLAHAATQPAQHLFFAGLRAGVTFR